MRQSHKLWSFKDALKVPFVEDGMAVGLYGGSFNPPHEGHVHVAETAMKRLALKRLWWMVSPGNPLKDHSGLPELEDRIALSHKLIDNPRIDVTGLEKTLNTRYSADLVLYLRARYPAVRFIWVMGADNLTHFHKWERWEDIVQSMPIAIVDRPGHTLAARSSRMARKFAEYRVEESDAGNLKSLSAPAWTFLHAPRSHQSSTALRANSV
ncbi:MAG: nicotinate-nucleotide adenylyltransferase [Pseudomonadota bacterium]